MNEERRGLTRRSFLQTTAAVGIAACAGRGVALAVNATDAGENPGEDEQVFQGVCRNNCMGFCHLNVHVRDGKMVKTSRAPYLFNDGYSRICQRGLSHVHRTYDPDRIKYPMRRVAGTERGAGEWERVTWDEAFAEIAENVTRIQKEYGPQAVSLIEGSGNEQSVIALGAMTRLANLLQMSVSSGDQDIALGWGLWRAIGIGATLYGSNDAADMLNSKAIVVWGSNVTDSQVHFWHFMKEAMQKGAKLAVINPQYTLAASKADLWVNVRPGTDAALTLSLMNVILENGWQDDDYLCNHTCAPFLVKESDGMFLRRSDTGIEPEEGPINPMTGEPTTIDPYMVLQGGKLVELEKATKPAMTGSYDLDGVKCTNALDLLKAEIAKYPPAEAAEICDIDETLIYELAEICANGPVFHHVGLSQQAYDNGVHAVYAGITLCALTGNLGKPGASYGNGFYANGLTGQFNAEWRSPTGPNPSPALGSLSWPKVVNSGKYLGEDVPIKMAYCFAGNPLTSYPDAPGWIEAWDNMEYTVVADFMMTDTARRADLVLPVAEFFECNEITVGGQCGTINYNEKAIEPLYESKSDADIARGIAEALGLGEYFTDSEEEIVRAYFDSDLCRAAGMTYEKLMEDREMRFMGEYPYIFLKDGAGMLTSSGRLEFYSEFPGFSRYQIDQEITPELVERERLPRFFPPTEAWHENELHDKYPFHIMSKKARFRVHSTFYHVPMLRELDPEPTVEMNPADAQERGLEDGSYVECFNDRGHAVAKLVYSQGVRPGTLVYPKGWHMSQFKSGGWNLLVNGSYEIFSVNSNFMECLCDIRPWAEGGAAQ